MRYTDEIEENIDYVYITTIRDSLNDRMWNFKKKSVDLTTMKRFQKRSKGR